MATAYKITQPIEYYRKFLEQNVRPDGRELGETRATVLNIGSISTAEGSALVKMGNTTVMCGIKAELTAPKEDTPDKGFIVPNVDLPPLCSGRFKPGPPSDLAQATSAFMDDLIKKSSCVDQASLCIQRGKYVWVLFCDMLCLDFDGNIIDACVTALMAAFKDVRLPTVKMNEETGLPEVDLQKKVPLKLNAQPVSTTFAVFDDKILFVDPTNEEEALTSGSLTVVTLEEDKLCLVHKPGGSSLSDQQLQDCLSRSHGRWREITTLIRDTINSVDR